MKLGETIIIIFKKNLLTTVFTLFLIFLVFFSTANLSAAQKGLNLWAKNVVPSLFPFYIATELLNYTNLPYYLGKVTNKFMRPLFNIPGEGSYAFIMGIISGYPVGAKIVNKFIEEGTCSKEEAERMLAFTNNSGPLFIIGTVGISLFGDSTIGILLFITHIMSCLTVGLIFGFVSKKKQTNSYKYERQIFQNSEHFVRSTHTYGISDLGTILSNSITNAISTILLIGGFIVLFSIVISMLNSIKLIDSTCKMLNSIIPSEYTRCILTGLLELTNGVNLVSSLHTKYMSNQIMLAAFLLGFAGFSIFLQIFSISAQNKISMKKYFIGKLMQGFIAVFYTFIILKSSNMFYFDIVTL